MGLAGVSGTRVRVSAECDEAASSDHPEKGIDKYRVQSSR